MSPLLGRELSAFPACHFVLPPISGFAIGGVHEIGGSSEAATLSYALMQSRLGLFSEAAEWFEVFSGSEPDPDRRLLAHLSLARVHWWMGLLDAANQAAQRALKFVSAMALPRYLLPTQILAHCIRGEIDSAVDCFEAAAEHCGAPTLADSALDVGNAVLERGVNLGQSQARQFLALSSRVFDAGGAYWLEVARARLYEQLSCPRASRAAFHRGMRHAQHWLASLPSEYQIIAQQHPWMRSLRELRSV